MKSARPSSFRPATPGAFTLVELLVVIVLMGVLIAITIPAVTPLLRSSSLTKGGAMILDELNFSRQLALSENRDVEVRFYKLPPKSGSGTPQYRAFRALAAVGTSGSKTAQGPVRYFPDSIIAATGQDENSNPLSSLLDASSTARAGLTTGNEDLPGAEGTPYIGFIFRASGGTSLVPVDPPVGNWYLTVYLENTRFSTSAGNFFTVQIEPVTGRVRAYRP